MVQTPWGDSLALRSKKMRPGRGNVPEDSRRSQRERLFGAMVSISSEKGYEATRIADLVKMAGVSRAAFYEHFEDKKECLLAAVDALVEPTIALMERAEDAPTGEARVRQAVEAFLSLVARQPAASRMRPASPTSTSRAASSTAGIVSSRPAVEARRSASGANSRAFRVNSPSPRR